MFEDFYLDFLEAARDIPEELKSRRCAERYFVILEELSEKGKLFNLTAITDPEMAVRLHLVDSLHLAALLTSLSPCGGEMLDVGSGAGFPALPVASALENVHVTALDSTAKKCAYIAETAKKCGVTVDTLTVRAEEAPRECREGFDFVTARSVARLNVLAELASPFVKVGGYFLAMKGQAAQEEAKEAARAASLLGLTFVRSCDYEIDGGGRRAILVYKKTSPTPPDYPRRYAQIKKKPL